LGVATVFATTKVSDDGKMTIDVPADFKGKDVDVVVNIKPVPPKEEVDEYGWSIGFWEWLKANPITDPAFKRYPQGEADPPPSFDE
jgi:hypothetical protein